MARVMSVFVGLLALVSMMACAKNKEVETAPVAKTVALQALAAPKSEGATMAKVYGSDRVVWLAPDALVLPPGEIQSATATKGMVSITFTSDGAAKVTKYTAKHVGQEVAFIVDGQIVGTPKLKEPIRGTKMQITADPGTTDMMLEKLLK